MTCTGSLYRLFGKLGVKSNYVTVLVCKMCCIRSWLRDKPIAVSVWWDTWAQNAGVVWMVGYVAVGASSVLPSKIWLMRSKLCSMHSLL